MIDSRWMVFPPAQDRVATSCMLILPGRAQFCTELVRMWLKADLDDTLFVGVTPNDLEWYPMPRNAMDQDEALGGLPRAFRAIKKVIDKIHTDWEIPYNRIALAGFSAGGVMSIYMATHFEHELAGAISHAGAILDPEELPFAKYKEMPIILTHCEDDMVFEWYERYLPMRDSLEAKGYDLYPFEVPWGGHGMDMMDVLDSARIIGPRLGYDKEYFENNPLYQDEKE